MSSEQHNGESHLVKSGEIHFSDELQQSTVKHSKESSHHKHHEEKHVEQQVETKDPEIIIPTPIESRFPFTNDVSYLLTKSETKYKIAAPIAPTSEDTDSPNEEVLGQDSKSLIFALLKQVRIGMDLSRVVLPTFVLEPRSMLEKLTDFMTHAELMEKAPHLPTPEERMLAILKWYLSGFYIKPKGVKKPYNPILGEFCRYMWQHADHTDSNNSNTNSKSEKMAHHGSKTFYIGEQVSHHPPISAFYCSNRQAGFVITGSILFKSKFYGTSVGTILEGLGTLYLLPQDGEEYEFDFPSLYAKGFMFGTLTMELAGSVHMTCKKTGWKVEMEFKQKPMIGGQYNYITGKVKHHNDVMYNFSGRWDSRIEITNAKVDYFSALVNIQTGKSSVLWEVTPEVKKSKLPKLRPEENFMQDYESEKLWTKVSKAILEDDQTKATEYKTELEQIQRAATKHRNEANIEYQPRLFSPVNDQWHYKHFNIQPWDPNTEDEEIEIDGRITSKKK